MSLKITIENYVLAREALDNILIRKKRWEAKVAELTEELVGYIEMNPVASLESEAGFKLSKGTKRSADIVDYRALEEYALTEGDEYIKSIWGLLHLTHKMKGVKEELFTTQPNRRLLTILVKHYAALAESTGRDMNDLLPPGLKQRATTYIIMRKPTKKDKIDELSGVGDTLMDMAKRGAMENE